jgi:hypothetical protein
MARTRYIEWASGYQAKVEAAVAYKEIQRLKKKHGGTITPAILAVEAAKKSNPLHPEIYDRSPKEAAAEYYRIRAGHVMRAVVIRAADTPDTCVRAFTPIVREAAEDDAEDGRGFAWVSMEEAMKDPEKRKQVFQRALAELRACRKKYATLKELVSVWRAIDAVK